MTTDPSQAPPPDAARFRPARRWSWLRWPATRPWSENRLVRIQQQAATVAGWFFFVVGLIGLVGATVETTHGDQPVLARVISSKPLSDNETVLVTRIALPNGREGVIESRDSYVVSSPVKVVWQGEDNAYEEYSPTNRWIGPGIAFVVGVLLVTISRATRRPAPSSGPDPQGDAAPRSGLESPW